MFNWILASVEECAWHIAKTSAQSTTSVFIHHERKGNTDITDKISEARVLAKKYRVLLKAEAIKEELNRS